MNQTDYDNSPWRLSTPGLGARRFVVMALVALSTGLGSLLMIDILQRLGMRVIDWLLLGLFIPTFLLLCIAFWTTIIGILLRAMQRHPITLAKRQAHTSNPPPLAPTALVMPIYNEDTATVVHCLTATWQSLIDTGQADAFDIYLLSDSSAADQRAAERAAVKRLKTRFGQTIRLYYRARPNNEGRKPGNIRDFCERWGEHYRYMIVFDADSRMTGDSMLSLVRHMQANPQAGIIQSVPLPVGQRTVLGRFQQLSASLQAHAIATGLAFWQGNSTNYWGHNAIIRIRDFQAYCGLEKLPGNPPLGGDVMSHDYVEAGLMRRHGRGVYVLPDIDGSFEGMPGNLIDDLKRERRWCQGNLQHLRLVLAPGWRPMTRVNFLLGALNYLIAPLWLLFMVLGVADATTTGQSAWQSAMTDASPSAALLIGLTAVLLLLPRLLNLGMLIAHPMAHGHRRAMTRGGLLEIGFSLLRGPIMMLFYSTYIAQIMSARGARSHWQTGLRTRRQIELTTALRRGALMSGVAATSAGLIMLASPTLLLWVTPALIGPLFFPLVLTMTSAIAPQWLPATIEERRGTVPINRLAPPQPPHSQPADLTLSDAEPPPERFRGMPLQPLFSVTR